MSPTRSKVSTTSLVRVLEPEPGLEITDVSSAPPVAVVLPKAEKLLKVSIEPYISSILDALMEPTSRGFFEVRDVFFRELVDMSKNTLNNGTKEMIAQVGRSKDQQRLHVVTTKHLS